MNCEEILPASRNTPPVSRPVQRTVSDVGRESAQPCASSSSQRGESGRAARRPCRRKVVSMPSAAATGSRKRSVEPLSPQSASALSGACADCTA